MSAVEDVAKAIAATVRAKGWQCRACSRSIEIWEKLEWVATVRCDSYAQAKRLAAMMQQPQEPVRSVFDAMGIDPVDPLDRFPSVRGKA